MIIHGNKQISGIIYSRKASDGGGAVALTNIIRGPQVVFGGLKPGPFPRGWLSAATTAAILAAFGQTDGKAVIKATNAYLNQLAASDRDKATALAGFINEDPMMVCNIVETPKVRWVGSDGLAWVISNLKLQANDIVEVVGGFDVPDAIRAGSMSLFGMNVGPTSQSWMNPNQIGMNDYHPDNYQDYSRFLIGPHTAERTIEFPRRKLAKVVVDFGQKKKWVNGVQSTVAANFSGINMATLFANDCLPFYASNTNGTVSTGAATSGRMLSYFKVTRSGEVVFHGIPLVGQTKQGMIDAVSGAYFPNQGTGSFSEHIETSTP